MFSDHAATALTLVNAIAQSESGPLLLDAVASQGAFLDGLTASGWTIERPQAREAHRVLAQEVTAKVHGAEEARRGMFAGERVDQLREPGVAQRREQFLRPVRSPALHPGFGGQPFLPESPGRIRKLRQLIDKHNPACELEVDGGIDMKTAKPAVDAGANVLVIGTGIFGYTHGPTAAIREVQSLLR